MSGHLQILVGLPGSGKTTLARKTVAYFDPGTAIAISRDDLRMTYYGTKEGLTSEQEHEITALEHAQVEKALRRGQWVVVHDCNLRMQYRKQLAAIADRVGVTWSQTDLTGVPLEVCLARNDLRDHPVPEDVIVTMYTRYIKPLKGTPVAVPAQQAPTKPRAIYCPDFSLPKAVIVDVDGTVALHEGVRGPYDTSRYHLDNPNLPVIDLVRDLHYKQGYQIVFCSGRHEDFREVTEEWLYEHVKVPIAGLFMRPGPGPDNEVKLDLFDKHIRDNFYVGFTLDDRDRVVKAWRSIGLTCLQVAEGNF